MNKETTLDPSRFSASPEDVVGHYGRTRSVRSRTQAKPKLELPRHGKTERFVRGPIPLNWLRAASRCGSRSEAVAVLLWYAAGWQRSNPAKLKVSILAELDVHPRTARRVLARMQSLGLVSVEQHRGRSPLVTILDLPEHR